MRIAMSVKFHKKKLGEIQFHPSVPFRETQGDGKLKDREGAVYLDIASPLKNGDGDQMDWANKLVFKLNATELSVIIAMARQNLFPIRMIHDHNRNKTTLTIETGNVVANGDLKGLMTYRWSVGRNGVYHNVYLNAAEMHQIFNLFEAIQPILVGWGADLTRNIVNEALVSSGSGSQPPAQSSHSPHGPSSASEYPGSWPPERQEYGHGR